MNAPLLVRFSPASTSLTRTLAASLARSLRVTDQGHADLVIVDGSAGWGRRALTEIEGGTRRLLVIEPALDDPHATRELAARVVRARAEVVLSEGFSDDPAFDGFGQWLNRKFDIVTLRGWGQAPPRALLLSQLRILRAVGVQAPRLGDVLATPDGLLALGQGKTSQGQVLIRLCATTSAAAPMQQTLVFRGGDISARLDLFGGATARPAQASLTTEEGLQGLAWIYESAHRMRLRQLKTGTAEADFEHLLKFAEDTDQVMSALP